LKGISIFPNKCYVTFYEIKFFYFLLKKLMQNITKLSILLRIFSFKFTSNKIRIGIFFNDEMIGKSFDKCVRNICVFQIVFEF
jgi:hypothetical protein